MCKRQIFGSIFDVGKLIGFQKNPMIGREEGFGITDKLLGFYKDVQLEINQYIGFNVMKSIKYVKSSRT